MATGLPSTLAGDTPLDRLPEVRRRRLRRMGFLEEECLEAQGS
jgi:hypothetical protein